MVYYYTIMISMGRSLVHSPCRRPTPKEITAKLALVKKHLLCKSWQALDYRAFREDSGELNLCSFDEQERALAEIIREISYRDYAGSHPPLKGVREAITGRELFAFTFHSKYLEKRIYFKFAVDSHQLFIVSFHRARK
jgi:hypothetical protein